MSDINSLENILKNSLEGHRVEPRQEAWTELNRKLKIKEFLSFHSTSFNIYYLVALVAISVAGIFAFVSNSNQSTKIHDIIIEDMSKQVIDSQSTKNNTINIGDTSVTNIIVDDKLPEKVSDNYKKPQVIDISKAASTSLPVVSPLDTIKPIKIDTVLTPVIIYDTVVIRKTIIKYDTVPASNDEDIPLLDTDTLTINHTVDTIKAKVKHKRWSDRKQKIVGADIYKFDEEQLDTIDLSNLDMDEATVAENFVNYYMNIKKK